MRPVSPDIPTEGLLVGWSLEGQRRRRAIGFVSPDDDIDPSRFLEPILHTGEHHLLTVAPTGAGKGVGCIVPALLRYEGPVIVIDPKGENYAITARRRKEMGQKVVAIDPFGVSDIPISEKGRFNPLDFVSPDNPSMVEDAEMIANLMMTAPGAQHDEIFWPFMGGQLLLTCLLYQFLELPPEDWNLIKTRELVGQSLPQFREFAEKLQGSSHDELVRLAGVASNPADSTFGGYWAFTQLQTAFLKGDMIGDCITQSSFSLQEVVDGDPLSIYLILPPEKLEPYSNLLKLWVGVLIAALTNRRSKPEKPSLFILDEAAQLGALPQLRQAITLLRGYGVRVWSFWQDMSQLKSLYPLTWQTILNNCGIQQFFGQTGRIACQQIYDVSGMGSPQFLQSLERSEMILSVAGDESIIAQKPNYLADEPFADLFDPNPYHVEQDSENVLGYSRRIYRRSEFRPEAKSGFQDQAMLGQHLLRAMRFHPVDQDEWKNVETEVKNALLKQLRADFSQLEGIADQNFSFLRWPAKFYKAHDYFEMRVIIRGAEKVAYFLRKPDEIIVLDGSSTPIHELNKRLNLELRREDVCDYLFFFCSSITATHGRFLPIDKLEDLTFKVEPDEDYIAAISKVIRPARIKKTGLDAEGNMQQFLVETTLLYADTLYHADFTVLKNGFVQMDEDDVLFEQMPVVKDSDLDVARLKLTAGAEGDA